MFYNQQKTNNNSSGNVVKRKEGQAQRKGKKQLSKVNSLQKKSSTKSGISLPQADNANSKNQCADFSKDSFSSKIQKRTVQLKQQQEDMKKNKPPGMSSTTYLQLKDCGSTNKMVAQAKFTSYKKSQIKQLKHDKFAKTQFNSKVNHFERTLAQRKIDYGSDDFNALASEYFPGYNGTETTKSQPAQKKESANAGTGPTQLKENKTGLPDNLKSGVENLSGMDISDVRVHRNSDKPASLNAHAYTQGTDIHVAPGQEKHLPHEAWHAVQQMQGRVQPTTKVGDTSVNDNAGLENEADAMGNKAMQFASKQRSDLVENDPNTSSSKVKQFVKTATVSANGVIQRFNAATDNAYEPTRDVQHPALVNAGFTGSMGPYKFYPMQGEFRYVEPTIAHYGVERFLRRTMYDKTTGQLYEPEKMAAVTGGYQWTNPTNTGQKITFHSNGITPPLPNARVQAATRLYNTTKDGDRVPGKVLDGIKANNNGDTPRAFVSVATEDGYGAGAHAHTVDRHVLNGAGNIPDADAVAARALFGKLGGLAGNVAGVYTPIASAFTDIGGANAEVAAVVNGELTTNWRRYRKQLVTNGVVNIVTGRIGRPVKAFSSARGGMVPAKYVPNYLGGPKTGRLPLYAGDGRWTIWANTNNISVNAQAHMRNNAIGVDESNNVNNINVRIIASDTLAHNGWFVHSAFPVA